MVDLLKKHKLEKHCCPPIDFCPIPWWKNDRAKPLSHWFEQDDPCRVIQGVQFPSRARVLAEAYCVATFFDSTSIDGFLRFSGDVRQHAQQCPGTLLDYLVKSVDGNSTAPAIQDPEALPAPSTADPTVVPVPSTLVGSPFSQARDTFVVEQGVDSKCLMHAMHMVIGNSDDPALVDLKFQEAAQRLKAEMLGEFESKSETLGNYTRAVGMEAIRFSKQYKAIGIGCTNLYKVPRLVSNSKTLGVVFNCDTRSGQRHWAGLRQQSNGSYVRVDPLEPLDVSNAMTPKVASAMAIEKHRNGRHIFLIQLRDSTSPTTEDPQEPPADATSTMPDRENWVTRIEKLPRHEVQALAKEYGVKANSATSLIKKSLIEKLKRVSRAGEES